MRLRDLYYQRRMPYAETPEAPRNALAQYPDNSRTVVIEIGPDGQPYARPAFQPRSLDQYQSALQAQDYAPPPPSFSLEQGRISALADVPAQYDPRQTSEYGKQDFWRDKAQWDAMPVGADREAYMRQMMIDRDVPGARLARMRAERAVNALSGAKKQY